MINDFIEIEQTLHGYFNGHHMLASSVQLSSRSEKTMDVLSDLSGPEMNKDFVEYITGYPLQDDQYYVIAKTWYATEMKRPGCVWTHSLLIKLEDLKRVQFCKHFLDLFIRPTVEFDKYLYSNKLKLDLSNTNSDINNLSRFKLEFLIWSIFNHNEAVLISANTSLDYTTEIIFLWKIYSDVFCNKFSFCTGSLANRKIRDKLFDLQFVPYPLAKSISRTARNSIVLENPKNKYPLWVEEITNKILSQGNKEFEDFITIFGLEYNQKKYFKKFAELYIDITRGFDKLNALFLSIDQNFDEYDSNIIKNVTVNILINNINIGWFGNKEFSDLFIELCTETNIVNLNFDIMKLYSNIEKIWLEDKIVIQKIFKKLINNNTNELGQYFINFCASLITPSMLPEFTNLDIRTCNILISINYELALCIDLWHQTEEFQLRIIDCLKNKEISYELSVKLINIILNNSEVELYDQLYELFNNRALHGLFGWSIKTDYNNKQKIKFWLCKKHPYEYIKLLSEAQIPFDPEFLLLLISVLDPYSKTVLQFGKKPWEFSLNQIDLNEIEDYYKSKIVHFFLPIILLTDDKFSVDIVNFIFKYAYNKLYKQEFDNVQWAKLEPFLPQLTWYNNWDKCKRLKKALKAKGY
ncbi:GAP1-N1 domain-containing protein [Pelosinus propionicus]|uniref:Uncharacterized protein n=1 Tax=Pelosinus propionicus DSM 13327 TaxID=1123291 RepID=A0A1I4P8Z0_9FIRM|nr:hypothetical protein [Pelosinus propionicus]SFM24046.1 hypothetical protein SAMN04490355_105926 [Pelosinus propionicus DSM 13327]